jgi:hypothetical protein
MTDESTATSNKSTPARRRRWTLWLLRVVVTVVVIQIFGQAAMAGGFLSGHYGSLQVHELNGLALSGEGWLLPVAAVLVWRPGRFSPGPILAGTVTYAAILAELVLGFSRSLVVHIPLGVLLVVALAFLCRWAWAPAPTPSTTVVEQMRS